MKKSVMITGMNGTVAPVIAQLFETNNHKIIPFNRTKVNVEDYKEVEDYILLHKPDVLLHFAFGSEQWAASMAEICYKHNIAFLFASTVDVLSDRKDGPYTIDVPAYAESDYGKYKIRCEESILKTNPNAYIVRLGWQIGEASGSNNMIDFLEKQMKEQGMIKASNRWYPSCSFLQDTAKGINYILSQAPGIYLLNSNRNSSFYDIVSMLKESHPHFVLVKDDSFERDDRMIDERIFDSEMRMF